MSIRYDTPEIEDIRNRRPILSLIARAAAWLVLASAALGAFLWFRSPGQDAATIAAGISATALSIIIALILFGFAQLVETVAKIERHTGEQKHAETLAVLRRIEASLAKKS